MIRGWLIVMLWLLKVVRSGGSRVWCSAKAQRPRLHAQDDESNYETVHFDLS